jgi:aspartokinase
VPPENRRDTLKTERERRAAGPRGFEHGCSSGQAIGYKAKERDKLLSQTTQRIHSQRIEYAVILREEVPISVIL